MTLYLSQVGEDPVVGGEGGRGQTDEAAGQQVDRASPHSVQNEGEAQGQQGPVAGQPHRHPVLVQRDLHLLQDGVHVEGEGGEPGPLQAKVQDQIEEEERLEKLSAGESVEGDFQLLQPGLCPLFTRVDLDILLNSCKLSPSDSSVVPRLGYRQSFFLTLQSPCLLGRRKEN